MANSIPAKDIVNVVPGVVSPGGTGLDMTGLILTESIRVPVGQVLSFATARAVSDYFGPTSAEASAATTYFNGYIGATSIPAFLLFAANVLTARAANQAGGIGLPLIVFEGTAAENRYAVRIAELPVLQAQLEAYE